eukprot:2360111-Pyramimonas_sp.AAC.1
MAGSGTRPAICAMFYKPPWDLHFAPGQQHDRGNVFALVSKRGTGIVLKVRPCAHSCVTPRKSCVR